MKGIKGLTLSGDSIEYNSLEEIIQNLTPEERELHKDLIEECQKREKESSQSYVSPQNIKKLVSGLTAPYKVIAQIPAVKEEVEKDCAKVKTDIYYMELNK